MQEKNTLIKTSYIMLSISAIISILFSIGVIGLLIFLTTMGISDSNGGGWLLFLGLGFGIASIPIFIVNLIHIFTWIIGLLFIKKNKLVSKVFGIISISIKLICGFILSISSIALAFSGYENVFDIVAIIIWILPTLYYGITLSFFIMSKTKT